MKKIAKSSILASYRFLKTVYSNCRFEPAPAQHVLTANKTDGTTIPLYKLLEVPPKITKNHLIHLGVLRYIEPTQNSVGLVKWVGKKPTKAMAKELLEVAYGKVLKKVLPDAPVASKLVIDTPVVEEPVAEAPLVISTDLSEVKDMLMTVINNQGTQDRQFMVLQNNTLAVKDLVRVQNQILGTIMNDLNGHDVDRKVSFEIFKSHMTTINRVLEGLDSNILILARKQDGTLEEVMKINEMNRRQMLIDLADEYREQLAEADENK